MEGEFSNAQEKCTTRAFREINPSKRGLRCRNELMKLVSDLRAASAAGMSGKTLISLSIGDPALDGNFLPPASLVENVVASVQSLSCNGLSPAVGFHQTREAIANYWTAHFAPSRKEAISASSVVVSSGCSDALSMCIGALCNEDDNILLPSPFFAHYDTICRYYKVQTKFYRCDHEKNWEIDFDHLRSLVDGKTKAILMNNPSNPCGSNFSRQHIADLVRVCEELQLPLIADEIYAGIVFSGETFTSVAEFDTPVPRFIISGLSKRFMVPGWRFGWVIALDRDGYGEKLFSGIQCMASRFLIPCSILQSSLVKVLEETSMSYYEDSVERMEEGAILLYKGLSNCAGLRLLRPRGSMFMSVVLVFKELESGIQTDVQFALKLAEEENVHVFPGDPFKMPGAIRLTVSRPLPLLQDAVDRIQAFCARHKRSV